MLDANVLIALLDRRDALHVPAFDRRLGRLARKHGVDLAEPIDDDGPWPFPT